MVSLHYGLEQKFIIQKPTLKMLLIFNLIAESNLMTLCVRNIAQSVTYEFKRKCNFMCTFMCTEFVEYLDISLCLRKPTIWVSDKVRHKPGCTVTEDS